MNIRRILGVGVVILGGVGLWILASELNTRRYHLLIEADRCVVTRGVYLPIGHRPFQPSDPALKAAYAPFEVPGTLALARGDHLYRDRVRLDQALFELYRALAAHGVESSDGAHGGPRDLDLTERALARIEALPGLSLGQREVVRQVERTLHYHQAFAEIAALEGRLGTLSSWLSEAKGLEVAVDAELLAKRARDAHDVLAGVQTRMPATDPSAPSIEESLASQPEIHLAVGLTASSSMAVAQEVEEASTGSTAAAATSSRADP